MLFKVKLLTFKNKENKKFLILNKKNMNKKFTMAQFWKGIKAWHKTNKLKN